jgi:dTDP-4-dehydrorhamnose 3,5-epimerase
MPFEFKKTEIPEVVEVQPKIFEDERGIFSEIFTLRGFSEIGITEPLTQVNYSRSSKGVLRGMHYQLPPHAQSKLVSCPLGEVFDVAVDIRQGSPTYGTWVGRVLSAENKTMLYIPEGFAHGFCVISEEAEVVYYCNNQYAPDSEGGLSWKDSTVGITWPIENPVLAERDAAFPVLSEAKNTFKYE